MISLAMEIAGLLVVVGGLAYIHPSAGAVVGGLGLVFLAQGVKR
jgi:hypothetical protein